MDDSVLITRRATVDDLPQLKQLWEERSYPVDEFERRITDFYLVENKKVRKILAVIGICFLEGAAMVHCELFCDIENQNLYRDMLWSNLKKLARNKGASRLWLQGQVSFWKNKGFEVATEELLMEKPDFPYTEERVPWFFFQLFDAEKIAEADFQLKEMQKTEMDQLSNQLIWLRNIGLVTGFTIIACLLIMFLISFITSYPGR